MCTDGGGLAAAGRSVPACGVVGAYLLGLRDQGDPGIP